MSHKFKNKLKLKFKVLSLNSCEELVKKKSCITQKQYLLNKLQGIILNEKGQTYQCIDDKEWFCRQKKAECLSVET